MKSTFLRAVLLGLFWVLACGAQEKNLVYHDSVAIGREKLARSDWVGAEAAFRKALEVNSKDSAAHLGLGQSLYYADQFCESLSTLGDALFYNSTNTNAYFFTANCCYMLGDFDEAATFFREYISLDPTNATACYWLGHSLYHSQKYAEAIKAYKKSIELGGETSERCFWLGSSLCNLTNYAEAEPLLRKAVSLDPENFDALYWLGYVLYERGAFAESVRVSESAVKLKPEDALSWCYLAKGYYGLKAFARAAEAYDRSAQLEPTNYQAYFWKATAQLQLKSYSEAAVAYRKALEINPEYFEGYLWLGIALTSDRAYEQAEEALDKAVEMEPENYDARVNRAYVLSCSLKLGKAVLDFEKAHQLKPGAQRDKINLFSAYLYTASYRKALELYPVAGTVLLLAFFLTYFVGLGFLMKWSDRPSAKENPTLKFALGWMFIWFEGMVLWMVLASSISWFSTSLQMIAAIIMAHTPILIAAYWAFPQHQWKGGFLPPTGISFRQVLKLVTLSWLVFLGTSAVYSGLAQTILGHGLPEARNILAIAKMLKDQPMLTFLVGAIVAPIGEEVIFRGLVFAAFRGRFGARWGIVISAVLFALCHCDLWHFLPLAVMGLVLGWVREKTGSIWCSALLHIINNALAFILLSLFRS